MTAVDLIVSGLSRLGETVLARTVLRPGFATRWLGSSGGLRRTVANPYVMDHDIVVMLTEAVLHSRESRRSAASWMAGVGTMVPATNPKPELISAIWGDHDPLYPLAEAESLVPSERLLVIPGGRYFHPEERPWETADRLLALTTT